MNCLEFQDVYIMEVSVWRGELAKFVGGNNKSSCGLCTVWVKMDRGYQRFLLSCQTPLSISRN